VPGAPHRVVTGPRCLAKDVGHFRKATQRIHHAPGRASFVELPLVATTPGTLLRQAT
jgi:hypothetical protein